MERREQTDERNPNRALCLMCPVDINKWLRSFSHFSRVVALHWWTVKGTKKVRNPITILESYLLSFASSWKLSAYTITRCSHRRFVKRSMNTSTHWCRFVYSGIMRLCWEKRSGFPTGKHRGWSTVLYFYRQDSRVGRNAKNEIRMPTHRKRIESSRRPT